MADKRRPSPNFFVREGDGSVRVRIRFKGEDASVIEEAAGDTPLMVWMHKTLMDAAHRQQQDARRRRPPVGPPE